MLVTNLLFVFFSSITAHHHHYFSFSRSIIKDTQMKWTLGKKMAFSKDKVMEEEVDERWSGRNTVLVLQGAPLLVASRPASSSLLGPTLKGEAELSWPQSGSISSLLLISKAHYFVLRLAGSQPSSKALSRQTAISFLPFHPTLSGHLPGL